MKDADARSLLLAFLEGQGEPRTLYDILREIREVFPELGWDQLTRAMLAVRPRHVHVVRKYKQDRHSRRESAYILRSKVTGDELWQPRPTRKKA